MLPVRKIPCPGNATFRPFSRGAHSVYWTMQEIAPKEVLAWWEALVEYGPAEVHPTLLLASLALELLDTSAPVIVQYGPWSLRCRTGARGLRRALQQLALAGWVHLLAHDTSCATVAPSIPPALAPLSYPGMWRAKREEVR